MDKGKKRPYLSLLIVLLGVVIASSIWIMTAPKIDRQGEILKTKDMDGRFETAFMEGRYMEETRKKENIGQYQLIYKNTSSIKPQVLHPKNEKDLQGHLLNATIDAFSGFRDADRIIVSIPYRHDVYEVNATREQVEKFLNKPLSRTTITSQEKAVAYFELLEKQGKPKKFFEQFGRIY